MAISNIVLFMVIGSAVVALGSLILSIIMIWNFSRKKTMGTALLAIFYGFIAIYHIIHSVMMIVAAQYNQTNLHKALFIAYIGTLFLSYFFLYIFAGRHIIPDNDIVKSIIVVVMIGVNAAALGMMAYELFTDITNPILYVLDVKPYISHYVPIPLVSILLYLTAVLFVEVRMIFQISVTLIRKEIKEELQRKGLQYILYGILSLFVSTLLTIFISIPNTGDTIFIMLYTIRGILTLLGLYLSFVGWILPKWFIKRVRRAWIVTKVHIGEEVKTPYISSKTIQRTTQEVEEINSQ